MKHLKNIFILLTLASSGFTLLGLNNIDFSKAEALTYDPKIGAVHYDNPDLYYQGIDPNLTGLELVEALSTLTSSGFVTHSYDELPQIYRYSDLSNGKMRMMYTGTEKSFNPGSMPGSTNKEHVWPASWYGTGDREEKAGSPGADAHNVWPCASDLNSKRGSCAFDELNFISNHKCLEFGNTNYANPADDNTYVWSTRGGVSNGQNKDAMYPAKGHRGETARILMYVATRYHNNPRYPVQLHDQAVTLKSGRIGKLSTLLKWHYLEPPTEWEIRRNNEVATRWHHNRNPFVDHPEYATLIYATLPEPDFSAPTKEVLEVIHQYGRLEYADPVSISVDNSNLTVTKGGVTKINATINPSDAKQAFKFESDDNNIAQVDDIGNVKGIASGNCKITVSALENLSIKTTVNVSVKELKSIEITGKVAKQEYEEGDKFNPNGLSVTATYSDGSTSNVNVNDIVWTDPNTGSLNLSKGTTSVKGTYYGKYAIYNGIQVNEKQFTGYARLSSKLDDYSGDYLLVSEDTSTILDGDAADYTKTNTSIQTEVTIKDDAITGDYTSKDFTISKVKGGYKITSSSGLTIGASSKSNLDAADSYVNQISFSGSNAQIKCGKYFLRFNMDGGNFRYYGSDSVGSPIALYKSDAKESVDPNPDVPSDVMLEVNKYAENFNSANVCGTNDNIKASSEIFLQQKIKYELLSQDARNVLTNGRADKNGTSLEQCLARYDRIIYLHGDDKEHYPDYMHRLGLESFSGAINNNNNFVTNTAFTVTFILGSIIAGISLTGGVLFVVLRKKKIK